MSRTNNLPELTTEYAIRNLHIVPVKSSIYPDNNGNKKKYDKFGIEIPRIYKLTKESKNVIKRIFSYHKYTTFYGDFKEVIPELTDAELYVNAVIHYAGFSDKPIFGELSDNEKNSIGELENSISLVPISYPDVVANSVLDGLFAQSISPSPDDISVMLETVQYISDNSSNREELVKTINNHSVPKMVQLKVSILNIIPELFSYYINNASDLIKYMESNNKIYYKLDNGKYKAWFNLSDKEPNEFAKIINRFNENDLATHVELFKRFLIAFKNDIDKDTYNSLRARLYNKPRSFNSIINNSLTLDSVLNRVPASIVLRNIVLLVKHGLISKSEEDLDKFAKFINDNEVPSRILIQLYNNISTLKSGKVKSRLVKRGNIKKIIDAPKVEATHKTVYNHILKLIQEVLSSRIDEIEDGVDFSNYDYDLAIPTSGESLPKSFRPAYTGTKISIDKDKDLTAFIYWHQDIDIDLSATFIKNDGSVSNTVAYTNLRLGFTSSNDTNLNIVHSGDITLGGHGAVEEIFIPKETKDVYRYALISVTSYTGNPLNEVKSLGFGFGNSKTEASKVDIKDLFAFSSTATTASPILIDLKTGVTTVVNLDQSNSVGYSVQFSDTAKYISILNNKKYLTYKELEEFN